MPGLKHNNQYANNLTPQTVKVKKKNTYTILYHLRIEQDENQLLYPNPKGRN